MAGAAIAGAGEQLPCSPALAFFYFCTVPLGYHPRLVRAAENSAMLQKWYNDVTYMPLPCWCTVGRSWLRTASSAQLHSTQGSSSVSASAVAQLPPLHTSVDVDACRTQ